ncbi:hypothetical protein ANCCAN_17956 [Ancylostoma caninum]|uniref:SXP/RAL-2 family protein Ani s 5-like cation-binding domain-containing protein n=1 Tax=Ancylostoma caninum TaxID=29170 RepID=A0A368FZJ4_ANCCA|nr:hypothetical protein ANCCAN_17956 [Ancylostoma caninum]
MNQWAKKFGLKDKFDAYKKNINDQRIKAQQKLDAALKALPNYYRQLRNIENDNTLTRPQADQKRRELLNTLTPKQRRAAEFLENLFAPEYARRPQPGPMRPGPYGPVPYGPGPYGPRPGPFGPGPYGPYGYCMSHRINSFRNVYQLVVIICHFRKIQKFLSKAE